MNSAQKDTYQKQWFLLHAGRSEQPHDLRAILAIAAAATKAASSTTLADVTGEAGFTHQIVMVD